MPLICVCVPPWVWLMQRLHQLWHRSLLLIISQHALGRVPPSSARPAKDPPPPSEFCNHTPHSPAAPRHWMLETNTLAHVRQHKHTLGLWRVARLSESHNGTWTRIAGINDDGGMQQPAKPADGNRAANQNMYTERRTDRGGEGVGHPAGFSTFKLLSTRVIPKAC